MLLFFIDWLLLALLLALALALLLYSICSSTSNSIINSLSSQVHYLPLNQIQILIIIEFLCHLLRLVSGVSIKEREQNRIKKELQDQDLVVQYVIISLSV
ncbi:hypothetical protein I7I53_07041 [Histoplasma capsulatum var. duboisii H88]|uniref:Uncharacterized protein n=1 Tax=Ajellomyces capsulatus (strain H88) TaxID=544711 RepID=A0A8A1LFJ0_AJEC8|nr:hypothetical protein I7I53_07041 [Histoplasma capsulatum var. duboisii H88]